MKNSLSKISQSERGQKRSGPPVVSKLSGIYHNQPLEPAGKPQGGKGTQEPRARDNRTNTGTKHQGDNSGAWGLSERVAAVLRDRASQDHDETI